MDNRRALSIIDQSKLIEKDKDFLRKHFEAITNQISSLDIRIMQLKDVIDSGNHINNRLLTLKESIISLMEEDKEKAKIFLKKILNLEGNSYT